MRRIAAALFGLFLLAFAVFEAVKYGGVVVPLVVAGFILPDLAFFAAIGAPAEKGQLPRRAVPLYNLLHHWAPPAVVLVLSATLPISHTTLLLFFPAALAWLSHIMLDRALGYGPRTRDGWQRGGSPVNRPAAGSHQTWSSTRRMLPPSTLPISSSE
ncbi:hypothetical protein BAY61_13580 [Prauserella marina]|uniref:Uncharacterized protein n=1 Tax=Prauserella marina TaxID=530584 RepID=A0A222VQ44_9PSEU|nr:DUF4260 family protein [Prauserella marina]ASR35863.1 hypothetical protein BAY61_13580 [Prauserella marina]PWV84220.1 uncharacterized protein DUF4260 [Prauserella marina]SDC27745.1 protein of unknown function [Prauserella marina]